ncbi:MAG TPA: stress response kinase A, partial [Gammaproteobacteria bacterium]|nr:stress response kinase A [Gammaproteobacteria bacterium]
MLLVSDHPFVALTPDWVLSAIESLGFSPDARFFALNSYENRVYQIGLMDGSNIIAKFYRPNRWTQQQILEEHTFTRELYELEIPVVPPMVLDSGESLVECDGFQIAIFPQLIGRTPDMEDLDSLLTMGR